MCKCVILCSETAVCRSNIHSHQEPCDTFPESCHRYAPLCAYWVFVTELQIIRGIDVSTVSFTAKTKHLRTPEVLFGKTRILFVKMIFVLLIAHSGDKIPNCIRSKTIGTTYLPHLLPLCFQLRSYTVLQFLLSKSNTEWIGNHFKPLELVYVPEFEGKFVVCVQQLKFSLLKSRTRQWLVLCIQYELWQFQLHIVHCSRDLVS